MNIIDEEGAEVKKQRGQRGNEGTTSVAELGSLEMTIEELLEALSNLPIHASIVDEELNIVWGNRIAKAGFGEDLIGMKCYTAYHSRSDMCPECLVMKTFGDGEVHRHITQVTPPEGSPIYFSCSSAVFTRDEDGNIESVIELSRKVTELMKRIEELEAIARLTAEREERMLELKEEIKALRNRLAREKPIATHRE